MKVVVIGAGPSGLLSAIYAAKQGNDVVILERNNKIGKKLLMTGNGKCNYFNKDMNLNHYYSNNPEYLKDIINPNNTQQILKLLSSIGIDPKIKNGYYYPYSNKAISVKDALVKECKLLNVKFITDFLVEKIIKEEKFVIKSKTNKIIADKVILATGSKAYPKTGSDGLGYVLAANFNHQIIKPLPALTGLHIKENYSKKWTGVRQEALLSLFEDDTLVKQENGEVQFTDYGISGICVFNLSTLVSKGLEANKKEQITINFLPFLENNTIDSAINYLNERNEKVADRTIFELLEGLLDYKLIKIILEKSNIDPEKYFNELNKKEKQHFAENLIALKLNIVTTNFFDNSQVCSGGVSLEGINPQTMESKIVKDLYIVGELLDVSGDCGGYNLAFAFITGMIAGKGTKSA